MTSPETTKNLRPCQWCGSWHSGKCPLVKAIDYYPDGTVKRVEFHDTRASAPEWPLCPDLED